jgi:hypothetical protein
LAEKLLLKETKAMLSERMLTTLLSSLANSVRKRPRIKTRSTDLEMELPSKKESAKITMLESRLLTTIFSNHKKEPMNLLNSPMAKNLN